ncbi:MAG: GxxExxY protein [Verrucomicrobiales bacterium]|jgi:GxxExxY protein
MPEQFQDGSYEIVGCAMRVHNELGFGLREKPYENALAIELELSGFEAEQQRKFPIVYRDRLVGDCIPDITVDAPRRLLIEVKAVERIGDSERAQVLNYLRITGFRLGLILNFGTAKLDWKRVILG